VTAVQTSEDVVPAGLLREAYAEISLSFARGIRCLSRLTSPLLPSLATFRCRNGDRDQPGMRDGVLARVRVFILHLFHTPRRLSVTERFMARRGRVPAGHWR
jgi:hypothetical protein